MSLKSFETQTHPIIKDYMTEMARYVHKNLESMDLLDLKEFEETGILWNLTIVNTWGTLSIAALDARKKEKNVHYTLVSGGLISPTVLQTKKNRAGEYEFDQEDLAKKHIKMFPNQSQGIKALLDNDRVC